MYQHTDEMGNTFLAPFTLADINAASPSIVNAQRQGFYALAVDKGACVRCGIPTTHDNLTIGGYCVDCHEQIVDEDNGGGSQVCPECGETAWNDADSECWACGSAMS